MSGALILANVVSVQHVQIEDDGTRTAQVELRGTGLISGIYFRTNVQHAPKVGETVNVHLAWGYDL